MKRPFLATCAVFMIAAAAAIWYALGLKVWTLMVGVLLLACPLVVGIVSWRGNRRTQRQIRRAVAEESCVDGSREL